MRSCLNNFFAVVTEKFEDEWLRRPNVGEIKETEERYKFLGFSGCIGAVDSFGWEWDKCPVAWQGNHIGRNGTPTCRMEIVCDDALRIWHLSFGLQ